jgi:hypothetical protein
VNVEPHLKVVGGTAAQAANDFYLSVAQADQLAGQFATNRHLAKLPPDHLRNLVTTAAYRKGGIPELKDVHDARRAIEPSAGKTKPVDPERMKALQQTIKENEAAEKLRGARGLKPKSVTTSETKSWVEQTTSTLKKLTTEQKIHTGLSMLAAGMAILGTFAELHRAAKRDEKGNLHVDGMHLLMAGVIALFGAGCAYVGVKQFQSFAAAVR